MNPRFACNYAVIRFLPYPESGEFVNIGVLLQCPETGYFDYRLEKKKFRRIANFFPELQPEIFKHAAQVFGEEIDRVRTDVGIFGSTARQTVFDPSRGQIFFQEIVRPRESVVRCSEASTSMTDDPATLLDVLFERNVERLFAREPDYQEEIMRQRLAETLRQWQLLRFYKQGVQIGNEEYAVRFPFVHESRLGAVERAIKPLNLAQSTSTKIYDHGEQWVGRVKRLRRMNLAPHQLLFTVRQPPAGDQRLGAFDEVCRELRALDAKIAGVDAEREIRAFAEVWA